METRARIAGAAVAIGLVFLSAVPALGAGRPTQMSPQQYQAMMLRAEGLNIRYGLAKPAGMTHLQYRAELIRGAGLNERYGLPVRLTSEEIARMYGPVALATAANPAAATSTSSGNSFDWRDAGIGAAVVIGLVLVGAAGALVVRHHGHAGPLHH